MNDMGTPDSNAEMLRSAQRMMDALRDVTGLCERAQMLSERADRIEKRRRDMAGDMGHDPAAAKPLAYS
jgi:hypothetical protein